MNPKKRSMKEVISLAEGASKWRLCLVTGYPIIDSSQCVQCGAYLETSSQHPRLIQSRVLLNLIAEGAEIEYAF